MNAKNKILISMIATVAIATANHAVAQCGSKSTAMASTCSTKNIVATAQSAGQFDTLLAAAKAAGLAEALQGDGPLTVFAPTDEAFGKLPKGTVESLLKPENREQLRAILKYHVVAGKIDAKHVVRQAGAATLNGQRIDFKKKGDAVMVDNARVIKADVKASNGIIHVIDTVIMPTSDNVVTTAAKAEKFNTLLIAAKKAGLADTLSNGGPFTVFAPTDEAFSNLPAGTLDSLLQPQNRDQLAEILKYHVVSGRVYSEDALKAGTAKTLTGQDIRVAASSDGARVNDARLLMTDVDASNGVIHVIDKVILPGS